MRKTLAFFLCLLTLLSLSQTGFADASAVADASQMTAVEEVVEPGMRPVYAEDLTEGEYDVAFKCSSSMFRIDSALLKVSDGRMEVMLTMGSKSFLYVCPGSAVEAASRTEADWIAPVETADGRQSYTIPVEALDAPIPCAAFSKNKQLWYDRTLLFRADSLPAEAFREGFFTTAESLGLADGDYTAAVTLSGGSGRASVESPARLTVHDGVCTARIVFSSKNYDYVRNGDEVYLPVNTEGNSAFELPVAFFDRPMAVVADTVAMSEPHEIAYTLLFDSSSLAALENTESGIAGHMELEYAKNFSVDYYPGGAARLRIAEQDVLLLPEDAPVPEELEALPQISIPAANIYLASSAAPDLFLQMGALDAVRYTSTAWESWNIPELRAALEEERILYVGKYSAPDYELLLTEGCGLVIENSMILHSPATKEKLEALGLSVLVEYSSYEPHPLGRVEWIKLYGLLCGRLSEAEDYFDRQAATFHSLEGAEPTGKTVAFFHISPTGGVTVRRRADYITRMIELTGGETAITDLPEADNALSTETIQMESFYTQARDADVLIYNSTAVGAVPDMESFLALSPLLADFKAVKEGAVWCTEKSMFQRSSAAADIMRELHAILCDEAGDELTYFYRIK